MKAQEVMEDVTTNLVKLMEEGADNWQMPWRKLGATGLPRNASTGKFYRGGNVLALGMSGIMQGFSSNEWGTFKQWQGLGGSVRKGEHGTRGLIYKPTPGKTMVVEDPTTGEDVTLTSRGSAFASVFVVFNRDQVDGLPEVPAEAPTDPLELLEHVEAWASAIPAHIVYGGDRACYSPSTDVVRIPGRDQFATTLGLYATLAHELAHWTGNLTRLNRTFGKRFGDDAYAAEELVAELSSAFTCATLGMDTVARTDHAPYLAHWCAMLKADPGILWSVGGKAQAATDFLGAFSDVKADMVAA